MVERAPREPPRSLGSNQVSLPNPRESTAKSANLRAPTTEGRIHRFAGTSCYGRRFCPIIRVGEVPGSNPGAPITICLADSVGIAGEGTLGDKGRIEPQIALDGGDNKPLNDATWALVGSQLKSAGE